MTLVANQILNQQQIDHIVRRIAFQIYETNSEEKTVILAGIVENGFILAQKIKQQLEKISPLKAVLCKIKIDKKNPLQPIKTSLKVEDYTNASIVLIDDVLNSGSTLIYGVKHFLEVPIQQIKTAVLVDRSHKKFPVKADFKGISLSTSLHENVQVIFEKGNDRAILE